MNDFWRNISPLALLTIVSSMLFWYIRTITEKAISDADKKVTERFRELEDKFVLRISKLEMNDVRSEQINGQLDVIRTQFSGQVESVRTMAKDASDRAKDNISDINSRLNETTQYSHSARHELGNLIQSQMVQFSEHSAMIRSLSSRLDKVESIPDWLDVKLNQVLDEIRKLRQKC